MYSKINGSTDAMNAAFQKIAQDEIKPKIIREKQKLVIKQFWRELRDEFAKKCNGSIATIERLYRKTHKPVELEPQYQLLIVCKNATDIQMLDGLLTQLNSMMGENKAVQICNTATLAQLFHSQSNRFF